jgi:hypothetical protein
MEGYKELNGYIKNTELTTDQYYKLRVIIKEQFKQDKVIARWGTNDLAHFEINGKIYHWFLLCFTLLPNTLHDPKFHINWMSCYMMGEGGRYKHPVDYLYSVVFKTK